jgi:hypothetical protein
VVVDVSFAMDWIRKKKVKQVTEDRLGLAVNFSPEPFDSDNLGSYQSLSMQGLVQFFVRDSQSLSEFTGSMNINTKTLVDLPKISKEDLTKGRL